MDFDLDHVRDVPQGEDYMLDLYRITAGTGTEQGTSCNNTRKKYLTRKNYLDEKKCESLIIIILLLIKNDSNKWKMNYFKGEEFITMEKATAILLYD